MFYYLFDFLEKNYQFAGASLFQYLSFRAGITFILALFISTVFGKRIINCLEGLERPLVEAEVFERSRVVTLRHDTKFR